jgi:hypothetical protein
MKLFLFDIRELMSGAQFILQPGDAGIGVHLKEDNQTISTEPGIPEHHIIHSKGIVTFGVPRLLKPDQRNSVSSIATQVYNFVTQNPDWYPSTVYRPVFDVTIDDVVAIALMMKEHRKRLLFSGTKLLALLAELNEWSANRYNFVKNPQPRLMNALLAIHQYPFYDYPGKSRTELCELTLIDMVDAFMRELDNLEPTRRTYPDDLKFDVMYTNDKSAMLRIKSDRYGADDLIVQEYFESNPGVVRVITLRKIKSTTKHAVTAYNSNLYDAKLNAHRYVETKELNINEKKVGGEPEWKNLKITILGPRRGSALSPELIWTHSHV